MKCSFTLSIGFFGYGVRMGLQGKEIVLGVTGGIACYKSLEIVRRIRDAGGNVSVIMTRSAREFVTPLSFQTLSARRVHTDLFPLDNAGCIDHIAIAERADAFLVAPATANSIAKFALGLADDFLSVAYLACKAPLLIAPAMNANMWEHPATRHCRPTGHNRIPVRPGKEGRIAVTPHQRIGNQRSHPGKNRCGSLSLQLLFGKNGVGDRDSLQRPRGQRLPHQRANLPGCTARHRMHRRALHR